VSGQNFVFNFLGAPASNGTGGTLVLHARGDYDGGPTETLSWSIEGIVSAGPVGGFDAFDATPPQGGPFDFVTVFQPLGNVEFQRTYSLLAGDLDAILADGLVSIFVDLHQDVGLFDPPNFVELTLSYDPVPEPSTLVLLGAGLLAGGRRLRSRRTRGV
jgi:hypothetical protein